MSDLPECFQHPLLNSPWNDRHMRALKYLAEREYAGVREIGRAAGEGVRTDGKPLNSLGASKHGGRIVADLMRLGFARGTQPYRDARGYYTATKEGRAVVTKGPLRYAVEREARPHRAGREGMTLSRDKLEPRWTSGEWRIEDMRQTNGAFWIGVDLPDVGFVSHAEIRAGCDEAREIGDPEANAHLIAAAPELYEALEFVFEHIADKERGPRDLYPAFGLDARRAIEMTRAALAKARGEP